jgi:hypothetical protein
MGKIGLQTAFSRAFSIELQVRINRVLGNVHISLFLSVCIPQILGGSFFLRPGHTAKVSQKPAVSRNKYAGGIL